MIRRIGLSLGADLCWPICFEEVVRRLGPVRLGDDEVEVEVERVLIEPFDLRQPTRYDVLLDRLTHWYHTSREWIKKAVLMDGLYVFNNPWSLQSMEKHTAYCAMMRLGIPVPDTWMVPPKEYEDSPDLEPTLQRYARLFDLHQVGDQLGYPLYMKPYDGGAWVGVSRIDTGDQLQAAYEQSGRRVMHLQRSVEPHDLFVRCVGVGPQVAIIDYDPSAPLHDRYRIAPPEVGDDERITLTRLTLTINAFFGWDFNSCEALRRNGIFHPIDFANACPDSQVTSLHYWFPWLVAAKVRWALFVAATGRKMHMNLNWAPFFEVAEREMSEDERLAAYGAIASSHFETERFEEFCAGPLRHLDEVTWEFFGTEVARGAVRSKVQDLYPPHEWDDFTELFWGRIQQWRDEHGRAPS